MKHLRDLAAIAFGQADRRASRHRDPLAAAKSLPWIAAASLLAISMPAAAEPTAKNARPVSLLDLGVLCNGSDETAAIQAALQTAFNSKYMAVGVPFGTCAFSRLTIPEGVSLVGESRLSSCLVKNNATSIGITMSNSSTIQNVCMDSSVNQTGGSYIYSTSNNVVVDDVYAKRYFIFAQFGSDQVQSVGPRLSNITTDERAVGSGSGFAIFHNYSNAEAFNIVVADPRDGAQADFGIRLDNGDTAFLNNINITRSGRALFLAPPAQRNLYATYIANSIFDSGFSNTSGEATPSCDLTARGNILETNMANVWCGLSHADGLLIQGIGTGTVDALNITNIHADGNIGNGIHVGGRVTNLSISNGTAGGNKLNGIFVSGPATHFSIANMKARPVNGRGPNSQLGINIAPTASDYYNIIGNDTTGNTRGGLFDGGTGVNKNVNSNF